MKICCFLLVPALYAGLTGRALAQDSSCNPWRLQIPPGTLTLTQRACFYSSRLLQPSLAMHGAMIASFGQWRNSPRIFHQDLDEVEHRFAVFYIRRGTQSAGEFLAGYLNREDPRPRLSFEHGFWNRTRGALWSVARVANSNGSWRPALSPIAGAFGSGMVSIACYRSTDSLGDGFRRTGLVYSGYFGTALWREFKPDVSAFAFRLLHRKTPD